uniref:Uncharacterized protein n=1 Tax=Klebsiella pneumoniae TaxID=573 RepID=A0A8B0SUI1_KLEPN|nr:hypothetical protein [Klebsiella pneumoniae]
MRDKTTKGSARCDLLSWQDRPVRCKNTCIHKQCVRYVKKITHEQHHSLAEFTRTRLSAADRPGR